MHMITLRYLNTELRFSMISQFIGKILSRDKKFCCTTLDSTFSLKTRWSGPYIVQNVSLHSAIEIFDPKDKNTFKVNGQRLKPFFTTESASHNVIELGICDPVYKCPRNSTAFPDVSCKSFGTSFVNKKREKKDKKRINKWDLGVKYHRGFSSFHPLPFLSK